jgi:hypothetical protein
MTRAEMLAVVATATASPVPRPAAKAPLAAIVTLQRDANALLAPFTVSIGLNNTTKKSIVVEFPTADLFRIDVLRDDTPVWSSLSGHKPIPINRMITVPPGVTKVASMTIDGTSDDHHAFMPGKYIVRVAMLGTSFGSVIDKEIEFAPPTPIDDVLRARPGTVFTIAGEQVQEGGTVALHDASGTVRISRGLAIRPSGTYVVRGFLDALADSRIFDIGRFAPVPTLTAIPTP